MNTARNKAVVHRLLDEIWTGRKFEVIDELCASDYVATLTESDDRHSCHHPHPG